MTLPTCEQVREQLPDALAGTLRAEDAHTLFAHVAGCADCRAEAELLQALRHQAPVTPAGLQARIVAAASTRRTAWILGRGRPALLAAALTGALLGGAMLLHRATTSAPQAAAPPVAVRAPAGAPTPAATSSGSVASPAPPVAGAAGEPDVRGLAQPLPGTPEAGLFAGSGSTDDLSEEELQALLKELES